MNYYLTTNFCVSNLRNQNHIWCEENVKIKY